MDNARCASFCAQSQTGYGTDLLNRLFLWVRVPLGALIERSLAVYEKEVGKLSIDSAIGYQYFIDKEHPLAHQAGKVYYHRHVASVARGRWLEDGECVHHMDGNRSNNHPSNLQVMSISEHSTLHAIAKQKEPQWQLCKRCGIPTVNSTYCSDECFRSDKRRFSPSREELEAQVWRMPSTEVAKVYGVSDVAIAKRCRLLGVAKPPRGYWAKHRAGKQGDLR